jgi:hypothetical protein
MRVWTRRGLAALIGPLVGQGGPQLAGIDQIGHLVEQVVLGDHIRSLKQEAVDQL